MMKMKIKFDVTVSKQMEIDVPANWMPFAKAYFTNEEERTNEQWDLLDSHTWGEMIEEFLAEGEELYETTIYSVEEDE
jgi:hypothetical protein